MGPFNGQFLSKISRRKFLEQGAALAVSPLILSSAKADMGPAGSDYTFAGARSMGACITESQRFDAYLCNCKKLFALKNNNAENIVPSKDLSSLQEFISHLGNDPQVMLPVRDIIVAAHYMEGQLTLKLYRDQKETDVDYETVDLTLSSDTLSISIPDELIGYNGTNTNSTFRFKGCHLGKDLPFLLKFKEALGGHIAITAPKYSHGLEELPGKGILEFMAYDFKVISPTALTRDDFIKKLQEKQFKYYDGTAIPDDIWKDWVPTWKNIWDEVNNPIPPFMLPKTKHLKAFRPLEWLTGSPLGKKEIPTRLDYWLQHEGPINKEYPAGQSVPTNIKSIVAQELNSIVKYNIPSDFTHYQRLGFSTKQDFLDAHQWMITPDDEAVVAGGGTSVDVWGFRYKYFMRVPIVDRLQGNAGKLIFNFHPYANSNLLARVNQQLIEPTTGSGNGFYARV